jgi:hypothetical protein
MECDWRVLALDQDYAQGAMQETFPEAFLQEWGHAWTSGRLRCILCENVCGAEESELHQPFVLAIRVREPMRLFVICCDCAFDSSDNKFGQQAIAAAEAIMAEGTPADDETILTLFSVTPDCQLVAHGRRRHRGGPAFNG